MRSPRSSGWRWARSTQGCRGPSALFARSSEVPMTSDNDVDRRIQDQLRAIEVPPGLEERVMAIARAQVARRATPARRQRKRLLSLALAGLLLTCLLYTSDAADDL